MLHRSQVQRLVYTGLRNRNHVLQHLNVFFRSTASVRSCLLQVVSTDLLVDIVVDIAVDSRSTLGPNSVDIAVESRSTVSRQLVDSRSIVGRQSFNSQLTVAQQSVDRGIDYRPSIGRYFDDAPRLTISHMLVTYRSTVGGTSLNCRANISHVLIQQVSPMAFFSSNDIINYCYHAISMK